MLALMSCLSKILHTLSIPRVRLSPLLTNVVVSTMCIFAQVVPMSHIADVPKTKLRQWQERYGLNERSSREIAKSGTFIGNHCHNNDSLHICKTCLQGNMCQIPFVTSHVRSDEVLSIIHTDVCGPT